MKLGNRLSEVSVVKIIEENPKLCLTHLWKLIEAYVSRFLGAAPHDLGTSGITCSSVESFLFELLSFQGYLLDDGSRRK